MYYYTNFYQILTTNDFIRKNSPFAFENHFENAMHVPGFYGDSEDFELEKITNFLSILKDVGKRLKINLNTSQNSKTKRM